MSLRLAIDARALSTRPTGVGHFLLAAVNAWSAERPDVVFELLSHKPMHEAARQCLSTSPAIRFHHCPDRLLPGNGLVWLNRRFEQQAHSLGATHLWGAAGVLPLTRRSQLPRLLTVHDLVYLSLPQTMAWRTRLAYTMLAGRAIRGADALWCVSAYTAQEVRKFFPTVRNADIVVGSGLNPMRQEMKLKIVEEERLLDRLRVDSKTLLFVGTLEPRKNLGFLLTLMPRLAKEGFRLLIVGCSGWGRDQVSQQIGTPGYPLDAVHFCDYLTDAELQTLYRHCGFFISASLLEGFGLPQLEAMSAGCPVIAAANSAVVEVVGSGGILIEGWDPDHWVERIIGASGIRPVLCSATRPAAERHAMRDPCLLIDTKLRTAQTRAP